MQSEASIGISLPGSHLSSPAIPSQGAYRVSCWEGFHLRVSGFAGFGLEGFGLYRVVGDPTLTRDLNASPKR